MTQIIDNFLKEEDLNPLLSAVASTQFPWHFQDGVNEVVEDGNRMFQFTHAISDNGTFVNYQTLNLIAPIINQLDLYVLVRAKINMTTYTGEDVLEYGYHVDYEEKRIPNLKTAVYYLNTNNGYTVFKDTKEKVYSVQNRMVTFDGKREHSGSTCNDSKYRLVLNINYLE